MRVTSRPHRRAHAWKCALVASALLYGGATHADVLVNNPAADLTDQDTQSGTALISVGNTVLAVFNDSGSFLGGGNHFTGYARSTDGGNTWADLGTLPASANGEGGYPVLARDTTTGTIYLVTLPLSGNPMQVFRSFDNGLTFTAPVSGTPGITGQGDKPWIAVDNFGGTGNGNVYLAARDFGGANQIALWRSTDGGSTFSPNGGTTVASAAIEHVNGVNIGIGPDHSVYAAYFRGNTGAPQSIEIRRSTDFGATFGAPVTITSLFGSTFSNGLVNGGLGLVGVRAGTATPASFRTNSFPQMAVNPVNGDLYVVYNDDVPGTDKADIFLQMSSDNGATWSSAIRVNDDATTNDQWCPTLAVTPDGTHLGVFWYDRRQDAANNLIDYMGSDFSITGSTLTPVSPNFLLNTQSFLPEFGRDPVVNSVYMVDYDQATADNNFFYAAWADARDPSTGHAGNNLNVRFTQVPVGPGPAAAPEPASLALLLPLTAGLLAGRARRQR